MTKYLAKYSKQSVTRVNVVRQVRDWVYIGKKKLPKNGPFVSVHDTFGQAKQWLLKWSHNDVLVAAKTLERKREIYRKIKSLKESKS